MAIVDHAIEVSCVVLVVCGSKECSIASVSRTAEIILVELVDVAAVVARGKGKDWRSLMAS